jgi:predicted acyltransferase
MVFVPVPGIGKPDLSEPMMNWANYIDSHLLPGILWQKTWDPEGILSTIGAVVTGLFGMSAAGIIKQYKESKSLDQLMMYGFILAFTGYITHYIFPINKALWSSSFTLLTAGVSALTLGTCIYYIDKKKNEKRNEYTHSLWSKSNCCLYPFKPFGFCILQRFFYRGGTQ